MDHRQKWALALGWRGHCLDPAEHQLGLPARRQREAIAFDQLGRAGPILGRQRVCERLTRRVVLREPGAGTAVELGQRVWAGAVHEALAQHIAKQLMVAIPLPLPVAQGIFQAEMQVALINDGPVTIWIDSAERASPRG
jgi:hypothetical protein